MGRFKDLMNWHEILFPLGLAMLLIGSVLYFYGEANEMRIAQCLDEPEYASTHSYCEKIIKDAGSKRSSSLYRENQKERVTLFSASNYQSRLTSPFMTLDACIDFPVM